MPAYKMSDCIAAMGCTIDKGITGRWHVSPLHLSYDPSTRTWYGEKSDADTVELTLDEVWSQLADYYEAGWTKRAEPRDLGEIGQLILNRGRAKVMQHAKKAARPIRQVVAGGPSPTSKVTSITKGLQRVVRKPA